jgi:integrase
MSKSSKLSRQIAEIMQDNGVVAGDTGPRFNDLLSAAKRKNKTGRQPDPPRLMIRKRPDAAPVIVIRRYDLPDKTTGVVLRPGTDPVEAELVANIALKDYKEAANDAMLHEESSVDVSLKDIVDDWITRHASTTSTARTKLRQSDAQNLDGFFAEQCLGDIVWGSGLAYIDHRLEGVIDENKRRTLRGSAIVHLKMLRKAIEFFYANLSKQPDERRYLHIPTSEHKNSELFLGWDELKRILDACQGWEWDVDNCCRKPENTFEDDLAIVERYILLYFYGSRDINILPLQWGKNDDGGWIDAGAGIIYRSAPGSKETNKVAEPSHLIGTLKQKVLEWELEDQLLGTPYVIHDPDGEEITCMRRRFMRVLKKAGLEGVNKHVLKHTGVTLLTHAGLDINTLAVSFSTKAHTLQTEYKHLNFLWLKPKTSTSVDIDLTIEALERTSPKSTADWQARAALVRASRSKQ